MIITEQEFNTHWENWKNYIYKNMYRLAQINRLDYFSQKELVQIGRIAIVDALISYHTNGKVGNDANGLIKIYISGRQQSFCDDKIATVATPRRWKYDEDYKNIMNGYTAHFQEINEEDQIDWLEDNEDDDQQWIEKQALRLAMKTLSQKERDIMNEYIKDEYQTEQQIADKYGVNVGKVQTIKQKKMRNLIAEFRARLKKKYNEQQYRDIQSTS